MSLLNDKTILKRHRGTEAQRHFAPLSLCPFVPLLENEVSRLLDVLDTDMQHIRQSLLRLNELRSLVIKRDDVALSRLLTAIRAEADFYAVNESRRQSIRKALADAMGCDVQQVTLSGLQSVLPAQQKAQIADKKAEMTTLVNKLKTEYAGTILLLSECVRFNSLLLNSIFELDKTRMVTYRRDGATDRQSDKSFVSIHL